MAINLDDRVTPRGLIRYAQDYFKAFKIIQEKEAKILVLYPVKFYLLCHAIELALKAKLRSEGYSVKKLKGLKHDLTLVINKLVANTKIPLPKDYLQIISKVNIYYKTKQFEYFQKGYKGLVDIKKLEEITENIIKIFENMLLKNTATNLENK